MKGKWLKTISKVTEFNTTKMEAIYRDNFSRVIFAKESGTITRNRSRK